MNKYYVSYWSVDEDWSRGNKNSIHNFIAPNGEKCTVASKLHRINEDTLRGILELIETDKENKE